MTHADLHMSVRALVAGRGFSFIVTTSSIEQHPGRLSVEWSIFIMHEGRGIASGRDHDPFVAFRRAEAQLRENAPTPPPDELVRLGEPPTPEGQPL